MGNIIGRTSPSSPGMKFKNAFAFDRVSVNLITRQRKITIATKCADKKGE